MAFTTLSGRRRIVLALTLGAAVAVTLVASMATGGRGTDAAQAAARHPAKHTMKHAAWQTTRHATDDPGGNSQAGGPDRSSANDPAGNSQAGGPDPGETSGESSVESEHGQPGEPANGHADPPGAAGSDCTGDCVQ